MKKVKISDRPVSIRRRRGSMIECAGTARSKPVFENKLEVVKRDEEEK